MDTNAIRVRVNEATDKLQEIKNILDIIDFTYVPDEMAVHLNGWENVLLFEFKDYKMLPAARKLAKSIIPNWNGVIGAPWAPWEGHRCVTWRDSDNPRIEFRLSCGAEDFPANISGKDGCEWVKQTRTTETFVCNHG